MAQNLRSLSRVVSWMEGIWVRHDTSPSEIESGLRELLRRRHAESEGYVPGRVLTLVTVADREWRGEIHHRLESVGRYHPSRTILCAVEPGRTRLDAWATMTVEGDDGPDEVAFAREELVIDLGPRHLRRLDTIIAPLVVPDVPTVVWAPHGHDEAVDALLEVAQVVLLDTMDSVDLAGAVARASALADAAYVVDLAWLRTGPWRERLAALFDPAPWRDELGRITSVTIRHRPDSLAVALLMVGWLATRLGWTPSALLEQGGAVVGRAGARRSDVLLRLEPDPERAGSGLGVVSVETASGGTVTLEEGPDGLRARRRQRDGRESAWSVLGVPPTEPAILGEGIRHALLRDRTYAPALAVVRALIA